MLSIEAGMVDTGSGRYIILACRSTSADDGGKFRLTVDLVAGRYAFAFRKDDRETRLIRWTASPAIRSGACDNRLGLRCAGGDIAAGINGTRVAVAMETPHGSGQLLFGIGMLPDTPSGLVEARFDNLVVTQETAAAAP